MTDHPPLTDAVLEAIHARCEAATTGPWDAGHRSVIRGASVRGWVYSHDRTLRIGIEAAASRHDEIEADTAFIAAAREDVPRLIAEVRRLRERERYLEAEAAGHWQNEARLQRELNRIFNQAVGTDPGEESEP